MHDAPSKASTDMIAANQAAARGAGLKYVSDDDPGIRRVGSKASFSYISPRGGRVRDAKSLSRIKSLVIPPAWKQVWICADPNGHIQAVGRDARGRKQYRYHPKWRSARDDSKFARVIAFARALPRIRRTVKRDLAKRGLPRRKVLAAVIAVTEKTLIRLGNNEYANHNHSYGLTTLRNRHAIISSGCVRFEFRGKSGVEHEIDLEDPRLAKIIRECRDLPGEDLFQYLDEKGHVCDVTSNDVNAYLRQISGGDFTAKDFRTWAGTVLTAEALKQLGTFETKKAAKANVIRAVESVAKRLGNTRAVCRRCYIHPAIIHSYLDGQLIESLKARANRLSELAVLSLLQRRKVAA